MQRLKIGSLIGILGLLIIALALQFPRVGNGSEGASLSLPWASGAQPELPSIERQEGTQEVAKPSGIMVTGDGSVKAQPDVAYVTLGVQNKAATAQDAQQENARLMTAVIAKLQAMGLKKDDLRTAGLSVHPVYDRGGSAPSGYQANNQVIATVNDINQAGAVFDAGIGAGANVAGDIRFGIKNDVSLRQQALREAVKSARGKADGIAAELGVKIVGVASVSEASSSVPIPMDRTALSAATPATPVIPGEMTVNAQVTVVYRY